MSYYLHSVTRSVHTRVHRMRAAQHHTAVQKLAGGKFVIKPRRPFPFSEEYLKTHFQEVRQAWKEGRIEVRTRIGGKLVDLDTMQLGEPAPSTPLPNTSLDTAARDKPAGEKMRPYLDGKAQTEEAPVPSLLATPEPEDDEEKDEDAEDEDKDDGDESPDSGEEPGDAPAALGTAPTTSPAALEDPVDRRRRERSKDK